MRTTLFALCFALGVSLMIVSGYLPKPVTARPAAALASPQEASRPAPTRSPPAVQRPSVEIAPPAAGGTGDTLLEEGADFPPSPIAAAEVADEAAANIAAAEALAESHSAEPPVVVEAEPKLAPPVANAGPDRVVWIGWDEIVLDGSASTSGSRGRLKYAWRQITGPTTLVLRGSTGPKPTATGLPISPEMDWSPTLYEFELTVTDAQGQAATDSVAVVALAAPDLMISPSPQRRFELRGGYLLGLYESWATTTGEVEVVFRISSPVALTFSYVGGLACELRDGKPGRRGARYTYEAILYPDPATTTTWVEFLVNSEEGIPGLVRLGVTWQAAQAGGEMPANVPDHADLGGAPRTGGEEPGTPGMERS